MKEFKTIQVNKTEQSAVISLSHKPLNIIGFEMMSELSTAIDDASGSPVLLLKTTLEHFSAGVDVKIHTPDLVQQMLERFHDVVRKLYHFPGITLCAVRGIALGGGMELALCCDVILGDQTARLGFPEIKIACFPPVASILLPRQIGRTANLVLFTGEPIIAKAAQELGIIDYLYQDNTDLEQIINRFITLSPIALRSLKSVIRKTSDFDFDEALSIAESVYKNELLKSPDVMEGVKAFLEKRTPHFT